MPVRLGPAACLVALVAGVGARAQGTAAPQASVFRSGIDLLQVDVMVLDADGRPVRGLKKEDFELRDNGRLTAIDVIAEQHAPRASRPTLAPPKQDVVSNDGAAQDRLIVVVLDDLHIQWDRTEVAKDAARRLVLSLAGRAQAALVFTSGDPGVEFTKDPALLLEGIARLRGREDPFERFGPVRSPNRSYQPPEGPARVPVAPNLKGRGDSDRFITTMTDAVARMPRQDGRRKAIVLLSEGAVAMTRSIQEGGVAPFTEADWTATNFYSSRAPQERLVQNFIDAVRRSSVSIYAVDVRGKAKPGQEGYAAGGGLGAFLDDVATMRQTSLRKYADGTGGFAVVQTDDLAGGIDRVVDDLDSFYSIGFRPRDPTDRSLHVLDIRVNRPDLVVRYRRTYQLTTDSPKGPAPKDPLGRLANSPVVSDDLPLRAWATVLSPSQTPVLTKVAVWLESPTAPISEYAIYTFDLTAKKEVGRPIGRTIGGQAPTLVPLESPTLRPGRYQLRIAARDATLTRGGSVYVTVDVPNFAKAGLALTGFALGRSGASAAESAIGRFDPTLDRIFDRRAPLRVVFTVWRRPIQPDVELTGEILRPDGSLVRRIERGILSVSSGRVEWPLALDDLPAGLYLLRVTAARGATSTGKEIAFEVR